MWFLFFVCSTAKTLTLVCVPSFPRWNPVSQHQCPAGGEELQWPSLHCLPLADRLMGAVHRGLLHPSHQHISRANTWRRCLLLSGDANPQGHLCPGQCGPSSSEKVRFHIIPYMWSLGVHDAWMSSHLCYIHYMTGLFNLCQMINNSN